MFQSHACSEWTLLKNVNDDIIHQNVHWKTTWTLYSNLTGFRCDKERKHHLWSFVSKMLHNLLPWGRLLKQRRPLLYRRLTCIFCNEEVTEDQRHIRECSGLREQWRIIHQETYDTLEVLLQKTVELSDLERQSIINRILNKVSLGNTC